MLLFHPKRAKMVDPTFNVSVKPEHNPTGQPYGLSLECSLAQKCIEDIQYLPCMLNRAFNVLTSPQRRNYIRTNI